MSILDPSYMIDLGGIDVIQSQGVAIPGLYQKLLDNIGPCGNPLVYNWKFNGVFIPPQYVEPILEDDAIYINDIYVSSDDVLHIPSIEIQPRIVQLNVLENGEYPVIEGIDGYGPVVANVQPTISLLNVTENGTYEVPEGVDGFNPVVVNVGRDDPFALKNYIQSSGTQYINTGYLVKDDTEFEMVVNFSNTGSYPTIFGVRAVSQTSASGLGSFICSRWANNAYASVNWGSSMNNTQSLINHYGKKCLVEFTKGKRYSLESEDGYFVGGFFESTASATQNFPLYVFTLNTGGNIEAVNWCVMKLYRFRIFESGVLAHEFVPWQENGVACLKDTVTSEIKYNAGTGNFIYGTDT